MHPDQMYELRQLRHQELWAEAERERVKRECAGNQGTSGRAWLATWLRRLSLRRPPAGTLSSRAG
jgi:hypothetical protein